jgi:hypothetical protein
MTLKDRIASEFDLSTADCLWLELLDQACDAEEMILQLEALIASDGLLATGAAGQTRIHPAVVELRAQTAAYARLLAQLDISDEETFRQRQTRYGRKRHGRT